MAEYEDAFEEDTGGVSEDEGGGEETGLEDEFMEESDHVATTDHSNSMFEVMTMMPSSANMIATKQTRVTLPYLSKYEKTRILGTRALQLSLNAKPLIDVGEETDPIKIATMEFDARKIPIMLRRNLPDGSYEDWTLDELIILEDEYDIC